MINKYEDKSFGFLKKIHNPLYLFSQNMSEIKSITLLYLVSLTLILFFRRPDALLNSQPWAEDGTVFLPQVIEHSTHSIFITYAGYWHFIPRIITLIALQFGLAHAPFVMNLSALLISVFCISYFINKDFRFIISNDFLRFLCTYIIACLPFYEIYLNITNIQWFLVFFVFLWGIRFVFNFKPIDWKNKESILRESLFVLLISLAILTAPLSFLIVPFLMISYIRRIVSRSFSTQDIVLYLIPILTFAIHLCVCVSSHISKPFEIPSVFLILKLFSIQVIKNLFYWGDISPFLLDFLTFSLVIFILIFLVNSILKKTLIDVFLMLIILASLFYLIFSFLNRWGYSIFSIESLISIGRYLFIPVSFFIIWFIRQINEYKGNIILMCLLFLIIVNLSFHYTLTPYDNYNFKQFAKYYDPNGNYSCHIPINPNGWSMSFPCTEEATRVFMYNTTQDLKNSNRVPTFSRRL